MNIKTPLLIITTAFNMLTCQQKENTEKQIASVFETPTTYTVVETHSGVASYNGKEDGFASKRMANEQPMDSIGKQIASVFEEPSTYTVLETHSGVASYYGKEDGFAGKIMANGQPMDPNALTAAHRTLPFGTVVRIIHNNGTNSNDSVIVTITDRGPFTKNKRGRHSRLIDLSYKAAKEVGITQKGHANVTVEVLKRGKKRKKARNKQTRK